MRILITGASGFAGQHLVDQLLAQQHTLFVMVRDLATERTLFQHPLIVPVEADLLDRAAVQTAVSTAEPELIYHLAGQAYPGRSWENPAYTLAVNTGGTANLLEAATKYGRSRVVVVTSAEIYGRMTDADLPLTESSLPHPRHPYGISKWAAGEMVRLYWQRYQLPVIEARPFNHIGPRQALGFVVPDFASQLASIRLGKQPPNMQVGNLDARRDFTDVRDVVRAYRLLAEKGQPGEAYLICSGQPVSVNQLLSELVVIAGVNVTIDYDPHRMRPSDVPILYGSPAKLTQQTGWEPQIPLHDSLKAVFDEWLQRLEAEA